MQLAFDTLRERHLVFKSLAILHKQLNPFWHLEYYRCHRTIRRILLPHVHRHLPQNQQPHSSSSSSSSSDELSQSPPSVSPDTTTSKTRPKTVIDHALKEINEEQKTTTAAQKGGQATVAVPSQDFIEDVIGLTKQFIFAGHDTTAITLSFAYHYLARNPDAMRRLREEHDEVFGGEDVAGTPRKLREAPHLINALPYTTAVLKETLRLCPGTVFKFGSPEVSDMVFGFGRTHC